MINTSSHTLKHERNNNEIRTSISQNHFSVIWKLFSLHSSLHFHNLQSYSIDYTSFAREDFRLGSDYNTSSSCKEKAAQGIMYSDLPPRPSWLTIRLFCVCDVRILFRPSWHMMAEPHYRTYAESWRATIIVYLNTLKCLQILGHSENSALYMALQRKHMLSLKITVKEYDCGQHEEI